MSRNSRLSFSAPWFLILVFGLAGCSAPNMMVDDHFQQVWQTKVNLSELGLAEVSPDGSSVLLGGSSTRLDVDVRDGLTGNRHWSERPGAFTRLRQSAGLTLDDLTGEQHDYILAGNDVFVFKQHTSGDSFHTRSLRSGTQGWEQSGYSWSPAKWAGAAQLITRMIGQGSRNVYVGATAGTGAFVLTQGSMVQMLSRISPDDRLLLLLTEDGLVAFDRRTGAERWHVPEFRGGQIAEVLQLDNGDVIVVAGYNDLLVDLLNRHYVARIESTTGDVRWMEGYEVGHSFPDLQVNTQAYLHGDVLVVQTYNLQVFDLETGEQRLSARTHIRDTDGLPPVATDSEAIYSVVDAVREMDAGIAWGENSRVFRTDLVTGEEIWTTGSSRTSVFDLLRTGDLLLVSASGQLLDGDAGVIALDAATGAERWRSGAIDQVGVLTRISFTERVPALRVSRLILHDGLLYVAGPRALYALDVTTGAEQWSVTFAEDNLGRAHEIFLEGDAVGVIFEHGLAMYDRHVGSQLMASDRQRVAGYFFAGDRLFLQRGNRATIMDLTTREELGGFRVHGPETQLMGNLGGGVMVTPDGRTLFLLDREGTLARFNL